MTAPLDEKGLEAAKNAVRLNPTDIETAIRAYLAASPSPSMEMEVVGFMHPTAGWCHRLYSEIDMHCPKDGPRPIALVTLSQAQSALEAMGDKLAIAERNRDASRDNFHTMQQSAADLAAQVLRLTEENEALIGARNENAKLKGQRDAALARIKALEEAQAEAVDHVETLSELLKIIKEHWIDYDHVFSIAVDEADKFVATSALKENAL